MIDLSDVTDNEGLLSRVMTTIHGPLLAGNVLVDALGYSSSEAMRQGSYRNMVPVTLMKLPARKFNFALSVEVAQWLINQRETNCDNSLNIEHQFIESKSKLLKLFILEQGYLLHEAVLIQLLGLTSKAELTRQYKLGNLPFALFRIDHRQTKLFALSIEAFGYFELI